MNIYEEATANVFGEVAKMVADFITQLEEGILWLDVVNDILSQETLCIFDMFIVSFRFLQLF